MVNVSKEGQVFECEICGNVVEVKAVGGGELVCCGQKMKLTKGWFLGKKPWIQFSSPFALRRSEGIFSHPAEFYPVNFWINAITSWISGIEWIGYTFTKTTIWFLSTTTFALSEKPFSSRNRPYFCATVPCGQKSQSKGVCCIERLEAHALLQGLESTLIPTGTQLSDASNSRLSSNDVIWAAQKSVQASGWNESSTCFPDCS